MPVVVIMCLDTGCLGRWVTLWKPCRSNRDLFQLSLVCHGSGQDCKLFNVEGRGKLAIDVKLACSSDICDPHFSWTLISMSRCIDTSLLRLQEIWLSKFVVSGLVLPAVAIMRENLPTESGAIAGNLAISTAYVLMSSGHLPLMMPILLLALLAEGLVARVAWAETSLKYRGRDVEHVAAPTVKMARLLSLMMHVTSVAGDTRTLAIASACLFILNVPTYHWCLVFMCQPLLQGGGGTSRKHAFHERIRSEKIDLVQFKGGVKQGLFLLAKRGSSPLRHRTFIGIGLFNHEIWSSNSPHESAHKNAHRSVHEDVHGNAHESWGFLCKTRHRVATKTPTRVPTASFTVLTDMYTKAGSVSSHMFYFHILPKPSITKLSMTKFGSSRAEGVFSLQNARESLEDNTQNPAENRAEMFRAACLQNETDPEKLLNRYEKPAWTTRKRIRKAIRNATEKFLAPLRPLKYFPGTFQWILKVFHRPKSATTKRLLLTARLCRGGHAKKYGLPESPSVLGSSRQKGIGKEVKFWWNLEGVKRPPPPRFQPY